MFLRSLLNLFGKRSFNNYPSFVNYHEIVSGKHIQFESFVSIFFIHYLYNEMMTYTVTHKGSCSCERMYLYLLLVKSL